MVEYPREWMERSLTAQAPPADPSLNSDLEITDRTIPGQPGEPPLTIRVYRPSVSAKAPVLDDRMTTPSVNAAGRPYVVTRAVLGHMWRHYLGGPGVAQSPYAAPSRITDFTDLPPAYIETCELDPLRDEVIEYALRMLQAGISTDLRVIAGAPHAFDRVASAAVTREAFASRSAALRRAFRNEP